MKMEHLKTNIYNIYILFLLIICSVVNVNANDNNKKNIYASIDFNVSTPCNCNDKTDRTLQLFKRLNQNDIENYNLYAYDIEIGNIQNVQKLFKAFEEDYSILKISVIEWSKIMIIADDSFNKQDFENVAKNVFLSFKTTTPQSFLKYKNPDFFQYYLSIIDKKQERISSIQNK